MTAQERDKAIEAATKAIEAIQSELAIARADRLLLLPLITEGGIRKVVAAIKRQDSAKSVGLGVDFRLPSEDENKVLRAKALKRFDSATKFLHKALTARLPEIVKTVRKINTVTGYLVRKLDDGSQLVKLSGVINAPKNKATPKKKAK